MLSVPSHLQKIECVEGMGGMWHRFVPSRLSGTQLRYRKQLWYIQPDDWNDQTSYIRAHEEMVRKLAEEGGVGVIIYNLDNTTIPDQWPSIMIPFAKMHQRLHMSGSYEKWLIQTFVVVPNDIVYATLNAILTGAWRPTRPLRVVSSMDEIEQFMKTLWLPRAD